MTKEIQLGNGGTVLVDDADFERVNQYNWTRDHNGYAVRMVQIQGRPNPKRKKILLHRFVLELTNESLIDHVNRNKLDNRRENLRIVTDAQNRANSGPCANTTSIYKGVSFVSKDKVWRVEIIVDGKRTSLGRFQLESEAALAYDQAAIKAWGAFAYLNFPINAQA